MENMELNELLAPIVEKCGAKMYCAHFEKEEGTLFLRIEIDGKVDLDLCEKISNHVSEYLDSHDIIKEEAYLLDVCSIGIERPIKTKEDYQLAINNYIHVDLFNAVDKLKSLEGYLLAVNDLGIVVEVLIKTKKKNITIEYENIKACRHAIKF
ncbi:MAG: ribosome maturation factor RimP [Erysipelotrichaceae bacterium]|nr:ribosome maturation factor RimP [Erysipelotrichaceae bacterium]